MRYLLLFLTLVLPVAADTTYYVDTDTGSGSTCTVGLPCAHLANAEALITGTLTQNYIIEVQGTVADTTTTTFSGATPGAYTISVIGSAGAAGRHAGVYSTSKYRVAVSGAMGITISENNIRLIGFQIVGTGSTYSPIAVSSASGVLIDSMLLTGGAYGIYTSTNGSATVRNSMVWGCANQGLITNSASATIAAYNTISVRNGSYGFRNATGTFSCYNCYGAKNTAETLAAYFGTISLTTSASEDTTGTGGLQNIAFTTGTFVSVDIAGGTEDFHLAGSSPLLDVGTDESGIFTTDIDGQTRAGDWDIGADETITAPPAGGAKSRIIE